MVGIKRHRLAEAEGPSAEILESVTALVEGLTSRSKQVKYTASPDRGNMRDDWALDRLHAAAIAIREALLAHPDKDQQIMLEALALRVAVLWTKFESHRGEGPIATLRLSDGAKAWLWSRIKPPKSAAVEALDRAYARRAAAEKLAEAERLESQAAAIETARERAARLREEAEALTT